MVEVTLHAPFLEGMPAADASLSPSAVPAGVRRVNVTASRLGTVVATTTLAPGAAEATMALAPGATYDFDASVTGYVPIDGEIAWGRTTAVAEAGARVGLAAKTIVASASLGSARYEGVDVVVPLTVVAPNGERVPPTDYDVTYEVSGASLVESTRLGARVRPDGSGAAIEVVGIVVGMNAAHQTGIAFSAVGTVTPNDPSVGFDFVVPEVQISSVPTLLVHQPVVLAGNARDDTGVVRVEVYVNVSSAGEAVYSAPLNPLASGLWTLPWTPAIEGDHVLTVLAYDASGNVGRADVSIAVHLAPPMALEAPYDWLAKFPELRTDHEPAGLAVDGTGDVYQIFTHPALPADPHAFNVGVVSKHRADGATYWVRQYEGQFHMDFGAAIGVSDGIVVAGLTPGSIPGAVESGIGQAFVMKIGTTGEIEWATRFAPDRLSYPAHAEYIVEGLAVANDGDLLAVGYVSGTSVTPDLLVARFGGDGEVRWQRTFNSMDNEDDKGIDVVAMPDGGAILIAETTGTFDGYSNPTRNVDILVGRITSEGDATWWAHVGTPAHDFAQAIALAPGGGVTGVGITLGTYPDQLRTTAPEGNEGVVFRVTDEGTLVWLTQFATNIGTWPRDVLVDPSGAAHVFGSTRGAFAGTSSAGGLDAFHATFDADGYGLSVEQFGGDRHDQAWYAEWRDGQIFVMGDVDYDSTYNDRLHARRFLARITP